jgi:methionyl-tRNA formyltransferase
VRVVFFGSPEFALPPLRALHERFEMVLVVSQPDKPAGRGLKTAAPPVAREARRLGLSLAQPARLKGNDDFLRRMAALEADVAVTTAYGKILPRALLDLPRGGFLNIHASLLPKYRGAGPIQWALINGERETGVSIMRTEAGLDTGPVCLASSITIGPDERAPELFARLAELGAEAIVEALALFQRGELECRPQDHSEATMAPRLRREDGDIRWSYPAQGIYDLFRGVAAWPGARFRLAGKEVRVHGMRLARGSGRAGEVLCLTENGVVVAAADGAIELLELQPSGKARMSARDWANGYRVKPGVTLA